MHFTSVVFVNSGVLGIALLITIVISILDYVITAQDTKKFEGSSYGVLGTNIGFIIGSFAGALIGELIYDYKDHGWALRAATGFFVGFLASSFMKFMVCMVYLGLFVWLVWKHKTHFKTKKPPIERKAVLIV